MTELRADIGASSARSRPGPHLVDYHATVSAFRWDDARSLLAGLPDSRGLNIAHEALDRHVSGTTGDVAALRWRPKRGEPIELTYRQLSADASRFANVLGQLGCGPGTGVASLAGRLPGLYVAALGALKAKAVFTPLFAAFGPDPIKQRINLGRIEVLVTTARHYRRKVVPVLADMPTLGIVLLIGDREELQPGPGPTLHWLDDLLPSASDEFTIPDTDPEDRALLHFTSGTTGQPKGVVHVHRAVLTHAVTGQFVLDLHAGDRYWCTADPGWVTGTSYGIIAPLVNGVSMLVDEAEFDAVRWYENLETEQTEVFYTAPTALRMLARSGAELAQSHDLSALRLVASVGEPLDPETVRWAQAAFGVPILDNWWQTETGGIMIANFASQEVRPGSMGRPVPGIEAGLLRRDAEGELLRGDDGRPVEVTEPDESGELVIREGWPSMFRGYLDQDERYRSSFVDGWYRSGDLARRDADGFYWFVGRGDDVIKSAGHLIGPFEVESALNEHEAVVEAGVIGKPDETIGAVVKAFVVLAEGATVTDELKTDLMAHARRKLGPAVAPREIEFVDRLPHTRSGKIMRRLLKARELGLDEGDISTLENGNNSSSEGAP